MILGLITASTVNAAYVCGLSGDTGYYSYLSLRTCGSTRCRELLRLSSGTDVSVIARRGRWRKVRLSNGTVGWVHGRHLCY